MARFKKWNWFLDTSLVAILVCVAVVPLQNREVVCLGELGCETIRYFSFLAILSVFVLRVLTPMVWILVKYDFLGGDKPENLWSTRVNKE